MMTEPIAPASNASRRTPREHIATVASGLRACGYAVTTVRSGNVFYRWGDGPVGCVALREYSKPRVGTSRPLIWRWAIDCRRTKISQRAWSELGFPPQRRRSWPRYWLPTFGRGLELSCQPAELTALARWLPLWIDARRRGVPYPPLPLPPSKDVPIAAYAWTASAWEAMGVCSREEVECRCEHLFSRALVAMVRSAIAIAEGGDALVTA